MVPGGLRPHRASWESCSGEGPPETVGAVGHEGGRRSALGRPDPGVASGKAATVAPPLGGCGLAAQIAWITMVTATHKWVRPGGAEAGTIDLRAAGGRLCSAGRGECGQTCPTPQRFTWNRGHPGCMTARRPRIAVDPVPRCRRRLYGRTFPLRPERHPDRPSVLTAASCEPTANGGQNLVAATPPHGWCSNRQRAGDAGSRLAPQRQSASPCDRPRRPGAVSRETRRPVHYGFSTTAVEARGARSAWMASGSHH